MSLRADNTEDGGRMKIELWYDPVYWETGIRINGNWQDASDIYAFLYPVRRYPLQTWLGAAGSWPGIVQQLKDISRGEEIELEFHGRNIDFQDLYAAVKEMKILKAVYVEWNTLSLYNDKVHVIEENVQKLKEWASIHMSITDKIMNLKSEQFTEEDWMVSATSVVELQKAEKDSRLCCRVDSCILDSLEKLNEVERLVHSLRRPMDAVCCCFSDRKEKETFEAYALEFPRMQFVFALNSEQGWKEKLWSKYGKASRMMWKIDESIRLCESVLAYLDGQKSENDTKRMELVHRKMEGGFSNREKEELVGCNAMSSYIYEYQKEWQKLKASTAEHLLESVG